eukprot:4555410-Karenia_brevis.AAC.1
MGQGPPTLASIKAVRSANDPKVLQKGQTLAFLLMLLKFSCNVTGLIQISPGKLGRFARM